MPINKSMIETNLGILIQWNTFIICQLYLSFKKLMHGGYHKTKGSLHGFGNLWAISKVSFCLIGKVMWAYIFSSDHVIISYENIIESKKILSLGICCISQINVEPWMNLRIMINTFQDHSCHFFLKILEHWPDL